jgi:hypothetical protein
MTQHIKQTFYGANYHNCFFMTWYKRHRQKRVPMPEEIPVVKVLTVWATLTNLIHTVTSVTCNVDLRGSDLSWDIHSL